MPANDDEQRDARDVEVVVVGACPAVAAVDNASGRLNHWFGETIKSMVMLRPDRLVAVSYAPRQIAGRVQTLAARMAAGAAASCARWAGRHDRLGRAGQAGCR